jgi:hypothetical protein
MSDDGPIDPLDALEAEATDPLDIEMVQIMRKVALRESQRRAQETTDDEGDPLPRLDLDDPRASTDDPLLRIGYALLGHLPAGWLYAALHASAAADEVRTGVMVKLEGGGPLTFRHLLYLPDVAAACADLRRSMYEPARGAWYSIMVMLRQNGALSPQFFNDQPPFGNWGPGDAELLRRDQELYPRPAERLPEWHPAR